jgi:hypothetical protein
VRLEKAIIVLRHLRVADEWLVRNNMENVACRKWIRSTMYNKEIVKIVHRPF